MRKNIQPYNRELQSRKQIFFNNLIGGVGWAVGATVGLSLILTLLGFLAKEINVIPFIGNFFAAIINYTLQHQYIQR
ncbi:MAG TPA: DUF5665 domain-containing protein [Patescibacteria group bacterium]|nr:DUF5665 domain-containing protein [Patescibacteria group bacterium]